MSEWEENEVKRLVRRVSNAENELAAKDAEIAALKKHNGWMIDILRRIYHGIQVDRAEIDDCIDA